MAKFNTENLRKVVSLSLADHVKVGPVKVEKPKLNSNGTYDRHSPRGLVPIKLTGGVLPLTHVVQFRALAREIWGLRVTVEMRTVGKNIELVVYE